MARINAIKKYIKEIKEETEMLMFIQEHELMPTESLAFEDLAEEIATKQLILKDLVSDYEDRPPTDQEKSLEYNNHQNKKLIAKMKDNKIIEIFQSSTHAAKRLDTYSGHILRCCRKERTHHLGFEWRFLGDVSGEEQERFKKETLNGIRK